MKATQGLELLQMDRQFGGRGVAILARRGQRLAVRRRPGIFLQAARALHVQLNLAAKAISSNRRPPTMKGIRPNRSSPPRLTR